jgi:hypothetical protein
LFSDCFLCAFSLSKGIIRAGTLKLFDLGLWKAPMTEEISPLSISESMTNRSNVKDKRTRGLVLGTTDVGGRFSGSARRTKIAITIMFRFLVFFSPLSFSSVFFFEWHRAVWKIVASATKMNATSQNSQCMKHDGDDRQIEEN